MLCRWPFLKHHLIRSLSCSRTFSSSPLPKKWIQIPLLGSLLLSQSSATYLTMLFPLPCNANPLVLPTYALQCFLTTCIVHPREFTQVFHPINPSSTIWLPHPFTPVLVDSAQVLLFSTMLFLTSDLYNDPLCLLNTKQCPGALNLYCLWYQLVPFM